MDINNQLLSLKRNGKSFYWASKVLSKDKIDKVSQLYYVLRDLDDLADNDIDKKNVFINLQNFINSKQANTNDPIILKHLDFFNNVKSNINNKQYFSEFLDGMIFDQNEKVLIKDKKELLEYCYKVAGTVGLMMCPILGVLSDDAKTHASNLGIAMQLTNIARDVFEDASNNRRYIPGDECNNLEPFKIHNRDAQEDPRQKELLRNSIIQLLDYADEHYELAKKGYRFLPFRSKICISIAANIYREIGIIIKKNNYQLSNKRYYVSKRRKFIISLKTILGFA